MWAASKMPEPSGLVRIRCWPGAMPPLRSTRSLSTVPVTANPADQTALGHACHILVEVTVCSVGGLWRGCIM